MIASEGSVFLTLLFLGILRVRGTFKREQELSKQQKNFLLSITHELKSPIASIKLQLETIAKRNLDKEQQLQMLNNAISDSDRLTGLVEKVLLATKIENSSFALEKKQINFSEMLNGLILKQQYFSKHNYLCKITPDIFLFANELAIESIVLNLLENAEKYSPENSTIKIELSAKQNNAVLSITDEGIGINDEDKRKIFTKFYRVGSEETRTTKGTGLGLYIVWFLAKQHKATLTVKDNTPKGSIFEVNFLLK
jgi:K+-sensing histidine kinase KdpD